MMSRAKVYVLAGIISVFAAGQTVWGKQGEAQMAPLPLKVKGTKILNSKDEPVTLRGVNAACLEWTSDGEGHILDTVRVAIDDWKVNIIRLPLSQDRWFGKAPEQNDVCEPYRALVKEVVDLCSSKGCYILLDLHWSNAGQEWGTNIGQHSMPDRGSVTFWKDFAAVYANNPAVLFDLYNEPHHVSWDVWLKGGKVTDRPKQAGNDGGDIRGGGDAGDAGHGAGDGREKCRCRWRAGVGIRFLRHPRRQAA
ncbi:MAG: cellulase family glycosylhydrolase [Planctomycetota bacterium]